VLQSSSPSYVLMASLDAARQQVQQLQLGHHDDDESFVVRGMRLATEARRLLNQLPPLRVLDGATLTLHPPPRACALVAPPRWQVQLSVSCQLGTQRLRAFSCRVGPSEEHPRRTVFALATRPRPVGPCA
jgi:hypothetical protein